MTIDTLALLSLVGTAVLLGPGAGFQVTNIEYTALRNVYYTHPPMQVVHMCGTQSRRRI